MTAREVAEYLGVAQATVYGWGRVGLLPKLKIGGAVRFRTDDVHKLLRRR